MHELPGGRIVLPKHLDYPGKTMAKISRWLTAGTFRCSPDAFAPEGTFGGRQIPPDLLSALSGKQQERAAYREALVMAFLEDDEDAGATRQDGTEIERSLPTVFAADLSYRVDS